MECILSSCGLNLYSWSASFAASCDESCDFKNATCANYLKNKAFVLFTANICSRNEVSSICAIKPAQDYKYKKLARPQERKFRLFRASFVLAVLKYNWILESCAGFNAQIDETSLREHIFAVNKTKSLFLS